MRLTGRMVLAMVLLATSARAEDAKAWFERTEQALMDAVAAGDKAVWDRTLASDCVITSEEGDLTTKAQLLADLRLLIPLTPTAFALKGSLGEWLFVMEHGKATRLVNLRKFAILVWTRVDPQSR